MKRTSAALAGSLVAAVLVAPAVAASATTGQSATTGNSAMVRIAGNLLPSLNRVASTAAPASASMTVGVALAHPHSAAELALVHRHVHPGQPATSATTSRRSKSRSASASPHRERATSSRDCARLAFGSSTPDAFGDYVSASGTVAAVERAFHVTIRNFTLDRAGKSPLHFLANTTAPARSGRGPRRHRRRAQHACSAIRTAQDLCADGTCTGDTTPQDLWQVYDEPSSHTGPGRERWRSSVRATRRTCRATSTSSASSTGLPQTKLNVDLRAGLLRHGHLRRR